MPHHSFISCWYNVFNFSSVFSFSCHTVTTVWYGVTTLGTGDQPPSDRVTLIQSHLSKRWRNASAMDVKGKMEFNAMSTKLSHQVRGHSKESRPIYLCESWREKKNSTLAYAELELSSHLVGVLCRAWKPEAWLFYLLMPDAIGLHSPKQDLTAKCWLLSEKPTLASITVDPYLHLHR